MFSNHVAGMLPQPKGNGGSFPRDRGRHAHALEEQKGRDQDDRQALSRSWEMEKTHQHRCEDE